MQNTQTAAQEHPDNTYNTLVKKKLLEYYC